MVKKGYYPKCGKAILCKNSGVSAVCFYQFELFCGIGKIIYPLPAFRQAVFFLLARFGLGIFLFLHPQSLRLGFGGVAQVVRALDS